METVLFREHKASFGAYLRALRVGRGLSLRDAASKVDVTFAKLQKMETGGRFRIASPAIFDAIAALFERPVAEVLTAAGVRFDVPPSSDPDAPWLWRFARAEGWTKIPDFTRRADGSGDCDDDVREAGFSYRALVFGHEGGLHVEVHPKANDPKVVHGYDFFVWVNIGDQCHPIVVPGLPDLLSLLTELKPLAEPLFSGITSAPPGWTAGGKPVGAFALGPNGDISAMVAATRTDESGLVEEFGRLRWK